MKPRRKDSGFAMLMVFLMAACVAIMLYLEMPRFAFEAERQRELLLIDRANQYKRAIQVFVLDKTNQTHRYPASIDELESFNNHRFLRKKYIDPLTGKDEWRLVHINGGMLTDSVTTQNQQGQNGQGGQNGQAASAPQTFITELQSMDAGSGAARGGVNRPRRPSETAGAPGMDSGMGTQTAGGSQGMVGSPPTGTPPPPPGGFPAGGPPGGFPAGGPPGGFPGGLPGGLPGGTGGTATGPPAQTCTVFIGGCAPTTTTPGRGSPTGLPGGVPGQGTSPGTVGQPGTSIDPNQASVAAGMINGLLTSPRPGGAPTGNGGLSIGGGIAGVASKFEAEGIMVIGDRTAINEWEFWFNMQQYRAPINPLGGGVGQQGGQNIGNGSQTTPPPRGPGGN